MLKVSKIITEVVSRKRSKRWEQSGQLVLLRRLGLPTVPTTTRPVWMPTPIRKAGLPGLSQVSFRSLTRLTISTAVRTAFAAWSGQARGQQVREDPWVELEQVQKAIAADSVLVEIGRFKVFDFNAKGKDHNVLPLHYAAWVIPPAGQGSVELVDLGFAEPIDAAVAVWRDALESTSGLLARIGETKAEAELRQSLAELTRLVYQPLARHFDANKQWLISPDGAIWLVPWAALTLADGRYAIEKHELTYLVSGRVLARSSSGISRLIL